MANGIPLSEEEQAFIWQWAYKKSWGHIAADLGALYPEHNGGSRKWETIKKFVHRKQRPALKIGYCVVPIRADVLNAARVKGFSQFDLSDLLESVLSEL